MQTPIADRISGWYLVDSDSQGDYGPEKVPFRKG
jgi:hypothetical protein